MRWPLRRERPRTIDQDRRPCGPFTNAAEKSSGGVGCQRVDQSSDRVGIEAALVEPAAHQKARRGAHAQTDAFLITRLDSPGVFPRRHASVIAGEVEAVLLGIAPEDP